MQKIVTRTVYVLVVILVAVPLQAQRTHHWWTPSALSSLPDIDSIGSIRHKQLLLFDFEHTLSLYRWGGSLYVSSEALFNVPTINVGAEGRTRLRQDSRIRTSEAGISLGVDYPLTPEITSALLSVSATSYSQAQEAASTVASIAKLSSITDGCASIGTRHRFDDHLLAEVLGGITVKSIEERQSSGPLLRSRLTLFPYTLDEGLDLSGTAFLDERHYNTTDEVLRNDGIHIELASNFAGDGYNIARAGTDLKRRDFFFPRDTSGELVRQERSEFSFAVHDDFYYPIVGDKLSAEFSFDIAPRTVTRRVPGIALSTFSSQFITGTTFLAPSSSSITASTINGGLQYLYPSGTVSASLRYEERSEDNALLVKDAVGLSSSLSKKISDALNATSFDARSTLATVRLANDLSDVDQINAELNARIYRYDTPSQENVDDRDEQYLYAILRYRHTFSPRLELSTEARLARGHLVYLESDRSAQNNTTRTIALSTSARYATERLRNTLTGEVFANYTTYDFLLPTSPTTNDFIIRGLSAADSFFIAFEDDSPQLSPQWGLSLRSEFRLSERGSFDDLHFRERPLLETSELLIESLLHCSFLHKISPVLLKIGARGFILHRRAAEGGKGETVLHNDEHSSRIGPLAIVTLDKQILSAARLYGSLWYGFVATHRFTDNARTYGTQLEARLVAEWWF